MNEFMELQRVINIVLRRWWLLVLLTALAAGSGILISQRQTPVYEATATVLVGQITELTNLSRDDIQMSELYAQTYADLAVRQPVLQGVVETLGLNGTWQDLRDRVQVSYIAGTQLIEIKAEASTPTIAQSIADQIAQHLIIVAPTNASDSEQNFAQNFIHQQMEEIQARIVSGQNRMVEIDAALDGSLSTSRKLELQTEKTNLERLIADNVMNYVALSDMVTQYRQPNALSIIETAHSENAPIRPRTSLNLLIGGGLGMLLALGIIFLWEFLDDSVKSTDDLSQFDGLKNLGTVGWIKGQNDSNKIVTNLQNSPAMTESYRMIRNKIRFGSVQNLAKSIVVTSPEPQEGKSTTAANLGIIMAQANLKTILVDADLKRPVLHQLFHVGNEFGLADLIESSGIDVKDALKSTMIPNLQIITSGKVSRDQAERLHYERIPEILRCLEEYADIIIIDSPPALLAADATILSNFADGVIMVLRDRKSKRGAIKHTLMDLQEANANLLGFIYNQVHHNHTQNQKYVDGL